MLIPIFLILLSFFAYKIRKRQMTIFERIRIPGPVPNLIFGNSRDIAKEGIGKTFTTWTKKYGPIVGFYFGGRPQILLTDMELIRRVFVKDFHLFISRHTFIPGGIHPQPQLRNSIAWISGNGWKQLRSTLSSSLSISKLNKTEPLITTFIEKMIEQIDGLWNSDNEFNFQPLIEDFSYSVSTNSFIGVNLSMRQHMRVSESVKQSVRPRLEKSMLAVVMLLFPSLTFIAYPLRVLWETIRLKMMWSHEGVAVDFVKRTVRTRKDAKTKPNDVLQILLDCEKAPPTGFASEVMDSATIGKIKERLSEDSVISNALILLLAGFETTATTLQFLISDLVNNQDVQNQLREELQKQVELNDGVANLQTFTKVPLLLYTIKETLRMHPPIAPFTCRLVENDYEYDGLRIPKGMGIFVDVMSIHKDPMLWPEPEKYKPERFATEYNKFSWLPFGVG